ncbi:hypothetical protein L9F63_027784, partial [Diploptera punctata]
FWLIFLTSEISVRNFFMNINIPLDSEFLVVQSDNGQLLISTSVRCINSATVTGGKRSANYRPIVPDVSPETVSGILKTTLEDAGHSPWRKVGEIQASKPRPTAQIFYKTIIITRADNPIKILKEINGNLISEFPLHTSLFSGILNVIIRPSILCLTIELSLLLLLLILNVCTPIYLASRFEQLSSTLDYKYEVHKTKIYKFDILQNVKAVKLLRKLSKDTGKSEATICKIKKERTSVLAKLEEDTGFKGGKQYLRKLLHKIGFKFKKYLNTSDLH